MNFAKIVILRIWQSLQIRFGKFDVQLDCFFLNGADIFYLHGNFGKLGHRPFTSCSSIFAKRIFEGSFSALSKPMFPSKFFN